MSRDAAAASYLESLPVAGSEQGLARMYGTAAAGNLRAKTGTIHGVSSLSGYVHTADGERLAFSILANGVPVTGIEKRTEDAIGARLARFSRSAPVAASSPPAPRPRSGAR
jgi:D-alanyl-D-alanine carboxypeptidase/D-alanyl-D-alanine-endopeptidase (penicillin-binding protein 4)